MNEHLKFLIECNKDIEYGFVKWEKWRNKEKIKTLDLQDSNLSGIILNRYNLSGANLKATDFTNAILLDCNLTYANLDSAKLTNSNCSMSNFQGATLVDSVLESSTLTLSNFIESICTRANFKNASLTHTVLSGADLSEANFKGAKIVMSNMIKCNLKEVKFEDCYLSGTNLTSANLNESIIRNTVVFGTSVWNITTENSIQENLTITNDYDDAIITLDDLEIANFIYLISNNNKIARAIDKISSKVVLILGRFTTERMDVLNHMKTVLKKNDYIPILFDFEKPKSRNLTETIGLIGRMSKFIVADLTDAKSIPQELSELIPSSPSITVQPVLSKGHREYSMFEHWKNYPWVKEIFEYDDIADLDKLFG